MVLLDDLLIEKQRELQEMITKIEKNRNNSIKGGLRVVQDKKHYAYYHYLPDKKAEYPHGKYIPKKEIDLARALAQRDYDDKMLNWAKECYTRLEKFQKVYRDNGFGTIYDEMVSGRKELVLPYELPENVYTKNWMEISFDGKKILDGSTNFVTERGEYVRSKSEKILADLFYRMNIPYKYERPIYLSGYGNVYPDFTLLNRRTRKEWYWEHFGLMDNSEYAQKAVMKIHSYMQNRIIPGKQLILTFEAKNNFDFKEAKMLIQEYLM